MIRGLNTATSGMLALKKRMDTVTNNIANATTNGYKESMLVSESFGEVLMNRIEKNGQSNEANEIGTINNGVKISEMVTRFDDGALEQTNRTTDLAISGEGFFSVQTSEGELYTRNGQFSVNADGFLITMGGDRVLGESGPLHVGGTEFSVDNQGYVQTTKGLERLKLRAFDDASSLTPVGGTLYRSEGGSKAAADVSVRQGSLEASNVDLVRQVTDMMEISRSYEINQRMIKILDEKLGKSVNDIGRTY